MSDKDQSRETVIVYAQRTAIGKFCGAFADVAAPQLGAALVRDALTTTNIPGNDVDEIIMGQVLTGGVGQAPARQTGRFGGLPDKVCAMTINRVCGSSLKAVMLADQGIRLGDSEVVFAGGQENMSYAPHLLLGSRKGLRFGSAEMKDHMQWDGLWDPYENVPMGNCGEICARTFKFSRQEQDDFALQSYKHARHAADAGLFAQEIVPFEIKTAKKVVSFDQDEEPFSVDLDKLPQLRPAFAKDGTLTAGNSSSINDGAALLVLMSADSAKKRGLTPLARITAQASYAHEPSNFPTAPIACIQKVLHKSGKKIADIDLFEINEAFAVVTMAAIKELALDPKKVNPRGGAVALGHPIGASGARILVTLIHGLRSLGGKRRGLAAICIGGGEASAIIVETV